MTVHNDHILMINTLEDYVAMLSYVSESTFVFASKEHPFVPAIMFTPSSNSSIGNYKPCEHWTRLMQERNPTLSIQQVETMYRILQRLYLDADGLVINTSTMSIVPAAAKALSAKGFAIESLTVGSRRRVSISLLLPNGTIYLHADPDYFDRLQIYSDYSRDLRTISRRKIGLLSKLKKRIFKVSK